MPNVRILSRQPEMPPAGQTAALVPVRAGALRRMAQGVAHACTWRVQAAAHAIYDYDTTTTPIEQQTPDSVSATLYAYWTATGRAKHVWCHFRLQAAEDKGSSTRPTVTVSLEKDDGTAIDPGFVLDVQLEREDAESEGRWPVFSVIAPMIIADTPVSAGAPRMLNIESQQGEHLAVKMVCTGVRIRSVDVWEFVPGVDAQTFSP